LIGISGILNLCHISVFAHAFGTIDKLYLLLSFHLQSVGNVQVGIGHSFQLKATGWKWKLTTCFGGDGISRIRNKIITWLVSWHGFAFCVEG
jgi:hypothetical protein